MQIGELASKARVTVQTVRFYERLRLLPEPQRKQSGYRLYFQHDLKRLLFVRQAKSLGFSLEEIGESYECVSPGIAPAIKWSRSSIRCIRRFRARFSRSVNDTCALLSSGYAIWRSSGTI